MQGKRITAGTEQQVASAYRKGWKYDRIVKRFGVSKSSIARIAKQHGMSRGHFKKPQVLKDYETLLATPKSIVEQSISAMLTAKEKETGWELSISNNSRAVVINSRVTRKEVVEILDLLGG